MSGMGTWEISNRGCNEEMGVMKMESEFEGRKSRVKVGSMFT